MYPTLITLVILLLAFGFVYSLAKARKQADVPYEEQTGNKTGTMLMIYVVLVGAAIIGTLIYAVIRL
ncbi:hypothetical protein DCC39_13780 [Pueribacillus theae]|uniref:Uncharacterized protein n=1 Tax=Pueribacillus theae TaxID=2171751 RepID=A0A2U1JV57_9BACI|nr:hypothetical protein [Pueribacillus theae]PWA09032.1 hypothetical protein DCC39_13780 [Pueribacillus theae]